MMQLLQTSGGRAWNWSHLVPTDIPSKTEEEDQEETDPLLPSLSPIAFPPGEQQTEDDGEQESSQTTVFTLTLEAVQEGHRDFAVARLGIRYAYRGVGRYSDPTLFPDSLARYGRVTTFGRSWNACGQAVYHVEGEIVHESFRDALFSQMQVAFLLQSCTHPVHKDDEDEEETVLDEAE